MSSIRVNWNSVSSALNAYISHRQEISSAVASVRSVKSYRCMSGGDFNHIYRALDRVIARLEREKTDIKNLENGLSDVLKVYKNCENGLSFSGVSSIAAAVVVNVEERGLSWKWKDTWKAVSKFGIVGKAVSAVGNVITNGWSAETLGNAVDNFISILGDVVEKKGKVKANWKEKLFGLGDALNGLDKSSSGSIFMSSLKKKAKDVTTKWGNTLKSLATNYLGNVKEFKGQENMGGRIIAETVVETATDIGLGAVTTAASTTIFAAAASLTGIAPCVAVVGVGTVVVKWAVNGICKWLTGGKDIKETVADLVCDPIWKKGKASAVMADVGNSLGRRTPHIAQASWVAASGGGGGGGGGQGF